MRSWGENGEIEGFKMMENEKKKRWMMKRSHGLKNRFRLLEDLFLELAADSQSQITPLDKFIRRKASYNSLFKEVISLS